jgi:CheY-like chemotaxis protein
MPGMDGWETARLLRANQPRPLPILVISADAFERNHGDSGGIVAQDFVVKPVSVAGLMDRIRARLDLIWIARGEATDDTADASPSSPVEANLPEDELSALRALGDIGHVRGILVKLEEIDRLDPRHAALTARLRAHVQAFRLPEFMSLLGGRSHDTAQP